MRRREFITIISSIAAWPLPARAQQLGMPVIGFLSGASAAVNNDVLRAFREGLSRTGYAEGRNVAIEYRWADGQNDRLPALAADLVLRRVNVIVAGASTPAALAAQAATPTIPIVFQVGSDPIAAGLVASLARPGGNTTGVTNLNTELGRKRLELLRELLPTAHVIALLVNPTSPLITEIVSRDLQPIAHMLGLQLPIVHASSERDLEAAFATLVELRPGALLISPDAFFIARSERLAALSVGHGIPAIAQFREFAVAGGLMSYGGSFAEAASQLGIYAGRDLKGEKPADLPVQQLTKVELTINLKTAKALGLAVPEPLLARADEVIE
jgi:putative tryptophan/tyrosine transport system substrate-binding protein